MNDIEMKKNGTYLHIPELPEATAQTEDPMPIYIKDLQHWEMDHPMTHKPTCLREEEK